MSTLKEKLFNAIFDNAWEFKTENVVPECEKIADEFAINFAKWYEFTLRESDNLNERFTPKQLLEIFKKEKGYV